MSKQSVRFVRTFCLCAVAAFSLNASADDRIWILDPTFHLNRLPPQTFQSLNPFYSSLNPMTSVALQSDGKIIVAGGILSDSGAYRGFARLLPNGEVDPDFQPGRNVANVSVVTVNARQNIYAITQTDDRAESIGQYDPRGQLLWSHLLSPRGYFGEALLPLPDGSILIGGSFTNVGDVQRKYIALISETGVVQTSFNPDLNGFVTAISRQQDGKIVIGGTFTSVNGIPRARLARLTSDGQLDESFEPGALLNTEPTAFARLPDGKIVVSGNFTRRNGSLRDRLLRMNADGSFDPSFIAELDEPAYQLVADPQNRIVLAGVFTKVSGAPRSRIARLLADGALDASFDPGIGPNSRVSALAIDAKGNYVIGGYFDKIGRRAVDGIARILPFSSTVAVDFADEVFSAGEQYREAVVELMRYGPTGDELIVDVWTEPGSDPELSEYKPFSTEVRFAPSDLDKTIIIPFPDDGEVEFTERIPIHCRIRGSDYVNTSQITVIDDEQPVVFTGAVPMTAGNAVSVVNASCRDVRNGRVAFAGYIYLDPNQSSRGFYGIDVLNVDGSPSGFIPAKIERSEFAQVSTLLWTADDKLLIVGAFTSINGVPRTNIARLSLDGSVDTGFTLPAHMQLLKALSDGKLLGMSWQTENSTNPFSLVRLNSNGSIDPTFNAPLPTPNVLDVVPLADGKILLNLASYGIRRLLVDGALDPTFNPPRPFQFDHGAYYGYPPARIFVQPDGKILVHGGFSEVDGFRRHGLARLNVDGSLDLNFEVPFDSVGAVFALPDGRFLANNFPGPWQLLTADGAVTGDALLGGPYAFMSGVQPFVALDDEHILDTALHIVPLKNRKLSSVAFDTTRLTLSEGGLPAEINVKRIGDLSQALTVPLFSTLVAGEGADDVAVTPSTLTFGPMHTQAAFRVQALADEWIESDERYRIRAGAPSDLSAPALLDVVIEDQNGRPGGATLVPQLASLGEASRLVTLDNGSFLIAGWTDSPLITYNPQTGATNILPVSLADDRRFVSAMTAIPGGFLLGGPFLGPSNAPVNTIFRFQSDGTRDTNFISPELPFYPRQILPEAGGTYLAMGDSYIMMRLNADGSSNRTYELAFGPRSAVLLSTNRLLYAGYYGLNCLDLTTGRPAADFIATEMANGGIYSLVLAGNNIYIGGWFTQFKTANRAYLARLTLDGKLDPTFHPLLDGQVLTILLDSKNRLLISGGFSTVNGVPRIAVARLNSDGSLDTTFDPDVRFLGGDGAGYLSPDTSITELPNGDIFTIPDFPNTSDRRRGVIITSDLPLRANLASDTNGAFQYRLATLPQKNYVIETSSNLTDWQSLVTTNANGYQVTVSLPPGSPQLFVRAKNPN